MRIGIIGAENSHTAAVAKTLNVDKTCGRARVVAVWGETKAYAEDAAAKGEIPTIVRKQSEMLGMDLDGVMIDHRHAKFHVPAAIPFVEARIPVFVDKPFSWTVGEGWKLIQLARKKGVAITSFSVLPEQESFQKGFKKQVREAGRVLSINSTGPCDLNSKWGGIFFYGIHQVDAILKAFGYGIDAVQVIKAGRGNPNAVAVMTYREGGPVVSMECIAQGQAGGFIFRAVGEKGRVDYNYQADANQYLGGVRKFLMMFKTGKEPHTPREMLEPIAVLEALNKSVKSGKRVKVAKLPG
ncbi:MAG: Gfo/Idh/MocA family oxidoreductase [Phycisphaerae bacterium]|nr:Gfo/Idh/MocA family oxidoreductase [Phycisphaerae bacterium]